MRSVCKLMVRLGSPADFKRYLDDVRAEYQRKRNFIKMLDHVRW